MRFTRHLCLFSLLSCAVGAVTVGIGLSDSLAQEAADTPAAEAADVRSAPRALDSREGLVGRRLDLPAFTDTAGKAGSLSNVMGKNGLVIVTRTTTCPVCRRYSSRLAELAASYGERGFGFLVVNPAEHESAADVTKDAKKHGLTMRHVADSEHVLARALGIRTTTEVFVLDRAQTLVYRGALDDQYGVGYARAEPQNTYLTDALDAVLAGELPRVAHTTAPGCTLKLKAAPQGAKPDPKEAVTYHGRIARILDRQCVECHREGENGPFPLDTYKDARGNAGMIAEMVGSRLMPPWFASPHVGEWENDRSLSDDDRNAVLAWVKDDSPQGDPAHAAVPIKRVDGWRIGKPDLVIRRETPYDIPATGVLRYRNFRVSTGLTEDRWVRAIEVRPTAPQVVHHVLIFVKYPKDHPRAGEQPRDLDGLAGYFAGMVPGQGHVIYPDGLAKFLPAGAQLRFQVHYTPNGEATQDTPQLGLIFADGKPEREVQTRGVFNARFRIPAGDPNFEVKGAWLFPRRARILAFMPHMHLRGKAARFEISPPGGDDSVVLDVPRYDFNWQFQYWLREPLDVEKRTVIRATGWFDNSDKNPANPDPTKVVKFGNQTFDEMMIGYVEWYPLD